MKGLPLPFLAVFAAAVSAAIGGSAVVATRLAVPESNPLTVTFLRFLGASVVMLAFTLPRTRVRIDWRDLPPVAGLALIQFALFAWFFSASLQYIPAARGALVLSTQPLLTLALAALLRRERFTLAKAAGGVIALAGVAFALGDRVSVPGSDTARGDLLMFGAAVTGSIYNVTSGFYLRKYPALVLCSVMVPIGALALFAAIVAGGDWSGFTSFSWKGWLAIAYLMTLGGAVTFFLWIWALEHTTPSRVAITVTMNPVSAVILGAFVLSEPVTWRLLVGLAAIILGIALANRAALMSGFRPRGR
ncbi:MAG TPA: DMT family transporter [Burkholderiales bacterium]|jgi:drug/metabolite transporter (DMT)-like permease|nr:DMT family transporter [Burkholderiales bacterium]